MNQSERDQELQRFQTVLQTIHLQLDTGKESLAGSRKELQDALENYWGNIAANIWDQAQQAEAVDRQRSLTGVNYRRRIQLEKMLDSPYFGRIDFREEEPVKIQDPEKIYLGIASLVEPHTGIYLIYDWRSPVAGMFYDFELGPAQYHCPAGLITGEITLKRQYKIVNGEMLSMFDTDLKIDDEILQEILEKSADSRMRTIVNSIQREQNRVIRDEDHRLLMVQGPAGSGKTSIALHRAAYLLYKDRNKISAKNILILSPNQIFSDYISGVLPDLGEENVLQTTFRDFIQGFATDFRIRIEERDNQLEYLLANSNDPEYQIKADSIDYKSSVDFALVIQNYLTYLDQHIILNSPNIQLEGQTILAKEEWRNLYQTNLAYLPPAERLSQIKQRVEVKIRSLIKELRHQKEAEIASTGEEVNEKTIKAMARLGVWRKLDSFHAQLDQFTSLVPMELYRKLFEDETLFHQVAKGTKIPMNWPRIRTQTLACFNQGVLPFDDLLPLVFLQGGLKGFPLKENVRHLIIDEAQDYTFLHFQVLKRLFPKSTWTILGDPAQSVHPFMQTADLNTIAQIYGPKDAISIRLLRSYRSTKEIQAFCQGILNDQTLVDPIDRSGPLPELLPIYHQSKLFKLIQRNIVEFKAKGFRSMAIICKTIKEATEIYQQLPNQAELTLITSESNEFKVGILVIPIYLAKGLEFDAVIISNASVERYSQETDRKLLYIACTRALHQLVLISHGECSPFIKNLNRNLFEEGFD